MYVQTSYTLQLFSLSLTRIDGCYAICKPSIPLMFCRFPPCQHNFCLLYTDTCVLVCKDAARPKLGGHEFPQSAADWGHSYNAWVFIVVLHRGPRPSHANWLLCEYFLTSWACFRTTTCHLASTPCRCCNLTMDLLYFACILAYFGLKTRFFVHENTNFCKPGGHDRVFVSMVAASLVCADIKGDWKR